MIIYFGVTGALSILSLLISLMMLDSFDVTELSLLPWHLAKNSEKLNWFGVIIVTLIHIALVPFLFALHFVIWIIYEFCMLCVKSKYRK